MNDTRRPDTMSCAAPAVEYRHPRKSGFEPMDRMMNKHSIESPDDSLADDMLVNEIIGKAGALPTEQPQNIVRIPAGMAHHSSAKA
jgi:hypothetical protein